MTVRAILTYHSLDRHGSVLSTDPGIFKRQMAWLASSHVRVTTVQGLLQTPPDEDAVAITFDDGFRNFATEAWPVLRDLNVPATLFVVTQHAGGTNAWEAGRAIPQLPLLGWDELGRLAEEGLNLGGHSRTHHNLTRLTTTALTDEVGTVAQEIVRRTGQQPVGFAYPYGAHSPRVVAAAQASWPWAVTTDLRVVESGDAPHRLPRLDSYYFRRIGQLEGWGTPRFLRRLSLRAKARILRRLVTKTFATGHP